MFSTASMPAIGPASRKRCWLSGLLLLAVASYPACAMAQDSSAHDVPALDSPALKVCRGDSPGSVGERIEACNAFLQSEGQSPKTLALAHQRRGYAYLSDQKWDDALADFSEAIRLDPENETYFEGRGLMRSIKADWDGAILDYDEAIRLLPTSATAFSGRAAAHVGKAELDLAIADYDEALRIGPPSAATLMNRADVYADKGEPERALRDVEDAFRLGASEALFDSYLKYRLAKPMFRVSPDGTEIAFTGGFQAGVGHEFERLLAANPTVTRVRLESTGGSVAEGRRFVLAIRARHLDTYVPAECLSACSDAFMAGRERLIGPHGRIGFHQRTFRRAPWQGGMAAYLAELRSRGVSEAFVRHATSTPAKDMWTPAVAELLAEHVVTRVTVDGEFPETSGDSRLLNAYRPVDFHISRGNKFFDKDQNDRALTEFDAAVRLDPTNEFAIAERGAVRWLLGDAGGSIADFSRLIELDPASEDAWLERGDKQRQNGNPDAAIRDFDAALRIDPNDVIVYLFRGLAYAQNKDHARAIADFDHALAVVPDLAGGLMGRGLSYSALGDNDRAIEDMTRAIDLDPDNRQDYNNRATVFAKMRNFEREIEDRTQVVRLQPNDASGWNNRCWARAIAGHLEDALADCNESLRLRTFDANTFDSRAFIFLKMGENPKAIADYDAALALNPKLALSLFGRGIAKLNLDDRAGGCADVTAALALDPDVRDRETENNLVFEAPLCGPTASADQPH